MQGAAYKSHITGVPGWESYDEQELLLRLSHALADKKAVIVEIGGEFGMSASILSKGAPDSSIYSIDITYDTEIGKIHASNLKEAGVGKNVHYIAADSHKSTTLADFTKKEKGIDLLFLDGDHSYDGALADLVLWSPLVKPGGKLAIHDTVNSALPPPYVPHALHYQVTKAVATWFADSAVATHWKQIDLVYSTLVFERTGGAVEADNGPTKTKVTGRKK